MPPAVWASPRGDDVQRIVHAGIVTDLRRREGVQAAQHVEVPPPRMVEARELGVDRLPGPLAAVEVVPQEELDRRGPCRRQLIDAVAIAAVLVIGDPFQDGHRGVHRGVPSTGPVQFAVEATIREALVKEEVHDAGQLLLRSTEVGRVAERHSVDAGVTDLDGLRGGQPAVPTLVLAEDQPDGLAGRRVVAAQPHVLEFEQRVVT
ncbi:MAG TPA: hypothetical protein VF069_03850 [Streptosporangiaceae bacterium]